MPRSLSHIAVLLLTAPTAVGCAAQSSPAPAVATAEQGNPDEVKPVKAPAEVVGKWRHEVKDAKASRTAVYHFFKDGRLEIETHLSTPDLNTSDLAKRAVTKVDGDKVTVVDISRTGADGVETVIPAKQRRTRTYQARVKGDELHWSELDDKGKPSPTPVVMKRVKEKEKA